MLGHPLRQYPLHLAPEPLRRVEHRVRVLGTNGGKPTINARMAPCGCALCRAPREFGVWDQGGDHCPSAQALWRLARHGGRVDRWDPPIARTSANFEGETAAGRPHASAVDWWGRVWDNNPACHPPLWTLTPRRRGGVAAEVHSLLPRVNDVWWVTLPKPGEVWATALWPNILHRVPPSHRRDLVHKAASEADRLAEGWKHCHPSRTPALAMPPVSGNGPPPPRTPPSPSAGRAQLRLVTFVSLSPELALRAPTALGPPLTCRHAQLPLTYPLVPCSLTTRCVILRWIEDSPPPPTMPGC